MTLSQRLRSVTITAERLWALLGAVVLVGVAMAPTPTAMTADTKTDLLIDPAGFLARAMQAWDPSASFGQMQNQSYGYLMPMGPFFLLGDLLHLPGWLIQRSWWCLLLLVAYFGVLRLAKLLGLGTPASRIVAAIIFALSPRLIGSMAAISIESWPTALAPWTVIPLITAQASGRLRRGAARSALAVALMGGVNAVAVLATLPLAFTFLLFSATGTARRVLMRWWLILIPVACLWWLVPLLVLGKYSFPFLDYIESANFTTLPASAFNVIRGSDSWLAFLGDTSQSRQPAGNWLALSALGIAGTAVVAILGLWGVSKIDGRVRLWLVTSTVIGVAIITAGYAGALGSPIGSAVQSFLDGPGSPLRNVHKFDVLLRLPIALGLAVAFPLLVNYARRPLNRWLEWRFGYQLARGIHVVPVVVVFALVLAAVSPALSATFVPSGSFEKIPPSWSKASAAAQEASRGGGRSLLVPGTSFATYSWGDTRDEPMQALARSPWAVRDAVPLGAPGATRLMDGFESILASGVGNDGLARGLARAGVTTVILRNDVDTFRATTPPAAARATLIASPGINLVAGFGKKVPVARTLPGEAVGTQGKVPAIEVFAVSPPTSAGVSRDDPRAYVAAGATPKTFAGGPEAWAATGAADDFASVATADGQPIDGGQPDVATDTLRRRVLNVGAPVGKNYGPTQTAGSDVSGGRAVADISPFPESTEQTVVIYDGLATLDSSSSASDPYEIPFLGPKARAFSAFDGSDLTTLVSAIGDKSPTLKTTFERPQTGPLKITLPRARGIERPTELRVTTAQGSRTFVVPPGAQDVVDSFDGKTDFVEVEIVNWRDRTLPTGITGLSLPGFTAVERLAVPGSASQWLFQREPGERAACTLTEVFACVATEQAASPEPDRFARTFSSFGDEAVDLRATASPIAGPDLERLLDASSGMKVYASSRFSDDPAARPGAALDGDPRTGWIPGEGDVSPWLRVRYDKPLTIDGVQAVLGEDSPFRVLGMTISSGNQSRTSVTGGKTGDFTFQPLTGREFFIVLNTETKKKTSDISGISVRELRFKLGDSVVSPTTGKITLPCGEGPLIELNGQPVRTRLSVSARDLVGRAKVPLQLCDPVPDVKAGTNTLDGIPSAAFKVDSVAIRPATQGGAAIVPPRSLQIESWGADKRELELGPGAASILAVNEGFNDGWRASIGDAPLTPVRVDGWKQGWVLPAASQPSTVEASFAPATTYRFGLLAGLLALVVVALLAIVRGPVVALPESADQEVLHDPGAHAPRAVEVVVPTLLGAIVAGLVGAVLGVIASFLGRRVLSAIFVGALAVATTVAVVTTEVAGHTFWAGLIQLLSCGGLLAWLVLSLRITPARDAHAGTLDQPDGQLRDGGRHDKGEDSQEEPIAGEVGKPEQVS